MAKILIVDDDPDFVLLITSILQSQAYEVLDASNGQEAMKVIRQSRPDLILLDVMMSTTLEGVEVSRELEATPELSTIPVLMISSISMRLVVVLTRVILGVGRWWHSSESKMLMERFQVMLCLKRLLRG